MRRKIMRLLFVLLCLAVTSVNTINKSLSRFPKDFMFGASTSAYQAEGAWLEDGKGLSVWDYYTHSHPEDIDDKSNADVAADSYHLYKRDVEMLQELGVNCYKFSISWPRILPDGLATHVNPKGIAYYDALIDELLSKEIEPFVTMYNWDLPQALQEKGGLLSDEFPKWFGNYARILYQYFGNRVKYWMTINEPMIHCMLVYEVSAHAPRIHLPGRGFYNCNRNSLLAHAEAYHIYHNEFKKTQKGYVSLNVNTEWPIAKTNSMEDAEAVKDYLAFRFGIYMDPIYSKKGNYPQRVINRVALMSFKQGLNSSRLPPLTNEEIKFIKGTSDYLPLNHYSSELVWRKSSQEDKDFESPSLWEDENFGTSKDPDWLRSSTKPYLYANEEGFKNLLMYVKDNYNNPPVYIIENGFVANASDHSLSDDRRVDALRDYLSALLRAIEDGANVKGYFAWSLMDNFEWRGGYTVSYGLYKVDRNDPNRTRIAKKSALVYKEIIRSRVIDYEYDPDPLISRNGAMTIMIDTLIGLEISIILLILVS